MERSKLEEFNHWWLRGRVDPELNLPYKRSLFDNLEKAMQNRFIVALIGLRRTGKTTLMYQIIDNLITSGVPSSSIVFFSFDETQVRVSDVVEMYREIHNTDFRQKRVYFFFDETQKCNDWENDVKKYYDLYPKIKFILTGSESLSIKKKKKESLAGRLYSFQCLPFSFIELLELNGVDKRYESAIMPYFQKFIERGGFPETFSMNNEREIKEYLQSIVVDKIIYQDIPKIFKIDDPSFLVVLLEVICSNPGMYLDYLSLSKQFGKDRRVIKNYISYLQESYLIRILGNYRLNNMSTLRKLKRAYPTDNGLIYLYKTGDYGRLIECAIVNHVQASAFWRNGVEIDIVYKQVPIEVKYQENIKSEDFRTLRNFMNKFKVNQGILITKKDEGKHEGIELIPAWKFLLKRSEFSTSL